MLLIWQFDNVFRLYIPSTFRVSAILIDEELSRISVFGCLKLWSSISQNYCERRKNHTAYSNSKVITFGSSEIGCCRFANDWHFHSIMWPAGLLLLCSLNVTCSYGVRFVCLWLPLRLTGLAGPLPWISRRFLTQMCSQTETKKQEWCVFSEVDKFGFWYPGPPCFCLVGKGWVEQQ